ncbi:MAG TPA: hypothetical protein VLA13_05515 [Massilibacterium sp.]|nr:hypothetical protein [Massilibacterium sp.]
MKQSIIINELAPMLNGKNGLKRMHWTKYKKVRDMWTWLIRAEKPQKHSGKVIISFTRFSTAQPDWDNLYASFKVIGDSLETLGIIKDDSMDIVTDLDANWKKVSKRKHQRTEITIEDI